MGNFLLFIDLIWWMLVSLTVRVDRSLQQREATITVLKQNLAKAQNRMKQLLINIEVKDNWK